MTRTVRPELIPKLLAYIQIPEIGNLNGQRTLAGNFDGMTASWGPLQWNIGQGTLGPLLSRIRDLDPGQFMGILGPEFSRAQDNATFGALFRSRVLDANGNPKLTWVNTFDRLYATPAAQQAFRESARGYVSRAASLATKLKFDTERGLCLCFDVAVQNGAPRWDHINKYAALGGPRQPTEWQRLKVFAQAVALCANPTYYQDVINRKTAIAVGGGTIHGVTFNLERDFNIRYDRTWFA